MNNKKTIDNLWSDFDNRSDTEENTVDKIATVAPMLSYIASVSTMNLYNKKDKIGLGSIKARDFDNVFIETFLLEIFFLYSVILISKIKNKSKVKDIILQETSSVLDLIILERDVEETFNIDKFIDKANKRIKEYSHKNDSKTYEDLFESDFLDLFIIKIGDILALSASSNYLIDFEKEILNSVKALKLEILFNFDEKK